MRNKSQKCTTAPGINVGAFLYFIYCILFIPKNLQHSSCLILMMFNIILVYYNLSLILVVLAITSHQSH